MTIIEETIEKIMEEAEIKMYDNGASDASDMKSLEQILTKHLSEKVIIEKKVIKKLKKELQSKADEFWKIDLENGVLGHGNTFEVGVATGIEEAIWHIEKSLLDNQE